MTLLASAAVFSSSFRAVATAPRGSRLRTTRVVALASVVEVGLRTVGVARLARWLGVGVAEHASIRAVGTGAIPPEIALVDRALAGWPSHGRCLRRSLVLGALLARHRPVMRIGVRRDGAAIRAHAWLEVAGEALPDAHDATGFKPLVRR